VVRRTPRTKRHAKDSPCLIDVPPESIDFSQSRPIIVPAGESWEFVRSRLPWYSDQDDAQAYRKDKDRRHQAAVDGGEASKLKRGIYLATLKILHDNPDLCCREVWNAFPDEETQEFSAYGRVDDGPVSFEVYRAMHKNDWVLKQIKCRHNEDRTGRSSEESRTDSILYDTFRGYVRKARKQLKIRKQLRS